MTSQKLARIKPFSRLWMYSFLLFHGRLQERFYYMERLESTGSIDIPRERADNLVTS